MGLREGPPIVLGTEADEKGGVEMRGTRTGTMRIDPGGTTAPAVSATTTKTMELVTKTTTTTAVVMKAAMVAMNNDVHRA